MWTSRIPVAFPADHIEAANALAALIDPDTGGAETFSIDQQIDGYVIAYIPFVIEPDDYVAIVGGRDAATWRAVVTQLATERGREDIDAETLELLRASMLFGDECDGLGETGL